MSQDWGAPPHPPLPRATFWQKLRGAVRLATFGAATTALMPLFLALRITGGSRDRWVAMLWSRIAMICLGLRWKRTGKPIQAGMLVVNHVSWIDPLALGAVALTFFVAKREVAAWPVIGVVCRLGRVEFVARNRSDVQRQASALTRRIQSGHLLCLFPEGTSTDGLRVLPFRSTLFDPLLRDGIDRLVQPVALRYRPRPGLPDSFYGWWGDTEFAKSLWQALTLSSGGEVTLSFLTPLRSGDYSDRKDLTRACGEAVLLEFNALNDGQAS